MINSIYAIKIQSCLKVFSQIGFDIQNIDSKYGNENFLNSNISKAELFTNALANKLNPNQIDFLNAKCSLTYFRDKRTPVEYGIDLMLGWLIEDAIFQTLCNAGLNLRLDGNDRDREYLNAVNISTQPDILIQTNPPKALEIFADWRGTWRQYGHADLRDNKFSSLSKKNALLLGVCPIHSEGFLIDFASQANLFKYVSAIKGYGGKPGYSCPSIKTQLRPLDKVIDNLITTLHTLR